MFKSIRWRFVLIYTVLLATAMIVAQLFIVRNFEKLSLENIKEEMIAKTETIISASSALNTESLLDNSLTIQSMIGQWGLAESERVYIIDTNKVPPLIVASSDSGKPIVDIFSDKVISTVLVDKAKRTERAFGVYEDPDVKTSYLHLAVPILTNSGNLNGVIYMTGDLYKVNNLLSDTTGIIFRAVLISMGISVVLGLLIANGITEPIRAVTKKAELMAEGDFNQQVEVKSDDEIGQLANMFNILTNQLNNVIGEMELERSKLSTIFQHMQEGLVAVDNSWNIIHANPIAGKILKLPENPEGYRFPVDVKRDLEEDPNMLLSIGGVVYRIRIAPFQEGTKEDAGKIVVFQDMTREHRLDEMRKEFVANVSHELKTPITTISTYVETILESRPDEETTIHFLETVKREADRMNRIVKDLLELSNMDYNKNPWKRERVNLKTLIEGSVDKLAVMIEERKHSVDLNLEEIIIEADSAAIERVLLNIISNSAKYTEDGGKISVSLKKEGDNAEIKIRDNGIGIPEKDLQKVFERFYRVEKGRSRAMGGTGLGLSIAKEIVEGHGGKISMSSVFGEGTETIIILPIAE